MAETALPFGDEGLPQGPHIVALITQVRLFPLDSAEQLPLIHRKATRDG